MNLRAIIFDFNGVIVNDEPVHMAMFQKALAEEGIDLSREEYYGKYLPMNDRECLAAVLRDKGREANDSLIERLAERKAEYYRQEVARGLNLFPGAADFIRRAAERYYLAIASGARRDEIEVILQNAGLLGCFSALVSAEDVTHGKPDPECYLLALEKLNLALAARPIAADQCIVIEDTPAGIQAAHAAGIKCVAVTNSYPEEQLSEAELAVSSLADLDIMRLEELSSQYGSAGQADR